MEDLVRFAKAAAETAASAVVVGSKDENLTHSIMFHVINTNNESMMMYCYRIILVSIPYIMTCIVLVYYIKSSRQERSKEMNMDQRCNENPNNEEEEEERKSLIQRKKRFLQSNHGCIRTNEWYGYRHSNRGCIDSWRKKEFPSLIPPVIISEKKNNRHRKEDKQEEDFEIYLDYAGSSIPSKTLLSSIYNQSLQTQILANPHSSGKAAYKAVELIEQTKRKILDLFHAHSGPLYYYGSSSHDTTQKEDYHPGYDIVFTSGATESLRIIGEHFQWSPTTTSCTRSTITSISKDSSNHHNTMKSILVYPQNVHTSIIGMRECALSNGSTFICCDSMKSSMNKNNNAYETLFQNWIESASTTRRIRVNDDTEKDAEELEEHHTQNGKSTSTTTNIINHLLVLPLECNFGGTNISHTSIKNIIQTSRKQYTTRTTSHKNTTTNSNNLKKQSKEIYHKWFTVLDIAKAACTQEINLKELDPDFACVSFYKMFGSPTGIGALFIKRSSKHVLQQQKTSKIDFHFMNDMNISEQQEQQQRRHYFGGGSVDIVLPNIDYTSPRSNVTSTLTHGTINFRGIISLLPGLDEIKSLGGMSMISKHTKSLSIEAVKRIRCLKHSNGKKVVELYSPWSKYDIDKIREEEINLLPGPTIAFNIIRYDGSYVGYNEVSKLASLHKIPIQFRVGCFCNPGGCQEALNLTDLEIKENYVQGGHVCGDDIDIINGKPTGAIRISFGKDSIFEDLDGLIRFIEKVFVNDHIMTQRRHEMCSHMFSKEIVLSEMYIYPIKSCAAMRVSQWMINTKTGSFHFDREFALVDSEGSTLRLKMYPRMGLIRPSIDLESRTLIVKGEGLPDLVIDLDETYDNRMAKQISVCGNKCGGMVWGTHAASQWFSSFLGVQCWLARYKGITHDRSGFENEAPILLVSNNAVNRLNEVMTTQGSRQINSIFFRPNIVVQAPNEYDSSNPEDSWKKVLSKRHELNFDVIGPCARCSMVDIDPTSGTKGGKTLRALAQYRRDKGRINFGVFLSCREKKTRDIVINEGERLRVEI